MKNQEKYRVDVVIVGGGPAGIVAGSVASARGLTVELLEKKERLMRKLLITGKGRCNITNDCDVKEFISNIKTNGNFLYGALSRFSPQDAKDLFEEHGLDIKVERGRRVFPSSDRAKDVADVLEKYAKESGLRISTGESVKKILVDENAQIKGVLTDKREIECKSVVIATGGKSYPLTGSTGEGYRMAKELGHRVTKIEPSLIPIVTKEEYCKAMQGLALKNVRLTLKEGGKEKYSEQGEMLFTHFGVSGPLVLSASCHMKADKMSDYEITIDLKPALDEKKLDERVQREIQANINKDFAKVMKELVPNKMVEVMMELSGIERERKSHMVTKEQRKELVKNLKGFRITPTEFRPIEEAIVTNGGIEVKEISPKTMESKLIKGLHFAGEVIDVDGYTGGYNLQIAYSTGYVAGESVEGYEDWE